jgi:parvulin-like peptidyl-prolyl isomerase
MRSPRFGARRTARSFTLTAAVALVIAWAPAVPAQELDPAEAEAGSTVVARVNGEALFSEDIEIVLEEIHRSQQVKQRTRFDLEQLMFRLVNDTLLAQEARALGMDEDPQLARKVEARRESKAKNQLFKEEIVERLDLSEKNAREVYEDVYRFATLRILTRRDRSELEALRPKLEAADEEAWAELAGVESQDPYAGRGGKVHAAFTDLHQALLDFAGRAKPGELSSPLASPWGWTYARLVAVEPADPEKFGERTGRVLVELRHRQELALRVALVERLKPSLGLEVDWAVYESVEVQRMHDGKLLPKFDEPERAVARLAGRTITVKEYAGRLGNAWSGVTNPVLATEYKPGVLDELIFEEMLVAEGLRRGYGDTPKVRRELHALEMSHLSSKYLKETVAAGVEVTPAEARAYYEEHRDEFRKPPRLHLLQLTVPTREQAERLAELAKGGAEFAWLVRQHSTDQYKEAGGDRGWVLANEGLLNFRDDLLRARKGDVLGPRESPTGWVVLKVDVYEEQDHYPFEAVSGNVKARLEAQEVVKRIDEVIGKLRERSEIWIDQTALAQFEILPAAPEEMPAVPGHGG